MKTASASDNAHSRSSFWMGLVLDVVAAAVIVGLFFLFLQELPGYRQSLNMQETLNEEILPPAGTEEVDNLPPGTADISFDLPEESGTAAEIEPAELYDVKPEETQAPSAEENPFRKKFAGFFTKEIEILKNSYTSPEVSVQITSLKDSTHGADPFNAYIADIHMASVENLQAGFPTGHIRALAKTIAEDNRAILGVNGDYYLNVNKGLLVRNGTVLQSEEGTSDICVVYGDGTMETYGPGEYTVEEILDRNPWQVWCFGPALLDENGQPKTEYNTSKALYYKNPRTAIGYYEPGHYCLVVIDGRQAGTNGASIRALASLLSDMGCKAAYNLDGGASSVMVFNRKIMNSPSGGGRKISDIVMVRELPTAETIIDGEG